MVVCRSRTMVRLISMGSDFSCAPCESDVTAVLRLANQKQATLSNLHGLPVSQRRSRVLPSIGSGEC